MRSIDKQTSPGSIHRPAAPSEVFDSAREWLVQGPVMIWTYFTRPFIAMFDSKLTPAGFLFLLLCGVWELSGVGTCSAARSRGSPP